MTPAKTLCSNLNYNYDKTDYWKLSVCYFYFFLKESLYLEFMRETAMSGRDLSLNFQAYHFLWSQYQ